MSINILVVDDEQSIADLIEVYLKNEDFTIYKFYNGQDALRCVESEHLELAILDVMLPDIDGFTLCRKIREKHNFPIIMLTAKEEEIDKITGLTLGADDYITKPFRPLELVARVKAQLRRFTKYNSAEPNQEEHLIAFSGLVLNMDTHECTLNKKSYITFTNHGNPIPQAKLETIFEKFYRLDSARSTNTGGAGLGLAIAKEIVMAHDGTISVESSQENTTFTVKLPS